MDAHRDRIRAYYAAGGEFERLRNDDGWFELYRSMRLIQAHIEPTAHVLDLGGGPGRYTVALATLGYRVTLVDLSPEHVAEARQRVDEAGLTDRVAGFWVGDAKSLHALGLKPFDAVLCFGPLYHVADERELGAVIEQTVDALKPGGIVLAAFVPRITGVSGLIARAAAHPDQVPLGTLTETLASGRFVNPAKEGFGEGYFAEPEALRAAFEGRGVDVEAIVSVRGLAAPYGAALRQLRASGSPVFDEVVRLVEETAHRPDVIGMSWHAILIGRRRPSS